MGMDASKSQSKKHEVSVSERLGLFVTPSLQAEEAAAPESEKADVRSLVSRRIEQSVGGLRRRLVVEEEAATDPEYIVDAFTLRGRRRGPVVARRG